MVAVSLTAPNGTPLFELSEKSVAAGDNLPSLHQSNRSCSLTVSNFDSAMSELVIIHS